MIVRNVMAKQEPNPEVNKVWLSDILHVVSVARVIQQILPVLLIALPKDAILICEVFVITALKTAYSTYVRPPFEYN